MQFKSRSAQLNGLTSLAYVGVLPSSPQNFLIKQSAPTTNDYRNVYVGDLWLDNSSEYDSPATIPTIADLWILVSVDSHVATWRNFGAGDLETLTGNSGGAVSPTAGNINVLGDTVTVNIVGNPGTSTLTVSTVGTGVVSSLTGNSGGAVFPTAGNTNIVGTGGVTVSGNPGTSTLTISSASTTPTSAFSVTLINDLTNVTGDGTEYFIPFDHKLFDLGNDYNIVTSKFVTPYSGEYCFTGTITLTNLGATATASVMNSYIWVNTIAIRYSQSNTYILSDDSGQSQVTNTWLIQLNSGDTVQYGVDSSFIAGASKTVGIKGQGSAGYTDPRTVFSGFAVINSTGANASSFPTDSGTATPSGGSLNVFGGTAGRDINTSGSGNTIHVDLKNAITLGDLSALGAGVPALTATTGDISITAGNINMVSTDSGVTKGAIKLDAVRFITAAAQNTYVGIQCGSADPTINGRNTAMGYIAFSFLSNISRDNSAFGQGALGIYTGPVAGEKGSNTVAGSQAASSLLTGIFNTIVGYQGGVQYTGAESNNIIIGSVGGTTGESNVTRIGTSGTGDGQQNKCFISGIRGITTANNNAIAVLIDSAGQLGTVSSSLRYKENVDDMGQESDVLYKLRPVTFNYKKHSTKDRTVGLIAEEVAIQAPKLVVYDPEGLPETVKYHELVPMLLNEIIKLNERINKLERA